MQQMMYEGIANCSGLDDLTDNILQLSLNMNGGNQVILYYKSREQWFYKDISGNKGEEDVEKNEIIIEGVRNGDIFISDEGIAVDQCGDAIFEEDA